MPIKYIARKIRSLLEKIKPVVNVVRDVFATVAEIILLPFAILAIAELFVLSCIILSIRGVVRFISSHTTAQGELV